MLNTASLNIGTPTAAGPRWLQAWLAVALISMLFCVSMWGHWILNPPATLVDAEARPRMAETKPQQRASSIPAVPVPPDLIRFALNALLVPLLDDAEPPRWTPVALDHTCGPDTRVLIDGKPFQVHGQMPANAFTVHWTIDRCRPFGVESVELSGQVELQLFHDDDGLSAIVTPLRLQVDSQQGRAWLERPFSAGMSLSRAAAGDE